MDRERRRAILALGIISGRVVDLDLDDYNEIGFDSYKFGYYGKPTFEEIKRKAEGIILDLLFPDTEESER